MKRSFVILLPLALVACSTTKPAAVSQDMPIRMEDQAYSQQQYDNVTMIVDHAGRWIRLSTTASVALTSDDPKSVDDAFRRAHALAYQNLVKFMSVSVNTKASTTTANDDDVITHSNRDQINEHASALLKGVMFEEQHADGDRVTVRAAVTPDAINAANQVREMMSRSYIMR